MIRDPSDGSVKPSTKSAPPNPSSLPSGENGPPVMATLGGADTCSKDGGLSLRELRAKYGISWGLKSLDREARKPAPAPTAEELRAHYATHNLGFKPKENT